MAFTVLASWDFRGADSAATKRVARIGGYTLTEGGTPTWSSDGVDCSASASDKLTLTLPSELKVSPVWFVASLRVMNATTPPEFTGIVGILLEDTSTMYSGTFRFARKPDNTSARVRLDGANTTTDSGTAITTGSDSVLALRRTDTNDPAIKLRVNNNAWVSDLITNDAIPYSATSYLIFGSHTSDNSRCRYHWFVMGSGGITDAEVQAIYDNPNAYIYPTPSGPSAAALAFFLSR